MYHLQKADLQKTLHAKHSLVVNAFSNIVPANVDLTLSHKVNIIENDILKQKHLLCLSYSWPIYDLVYL